MFLKALYSGVQAKTKRFVSNSLEPLALNPLSGEYYLRYQSPCGGNFQAWQVKKYLRISLPTHLWRFGKRAASALGHYRSQ